MYIQNPSIVITMPNGTTKVLGSDVIVQKSISIKEQVLNGLSVSSSSVSLSVRSCPTVKELIADNSPTLPCILYNNYTSLSSRGTAIFTGRLNGSFSYRVSREGEEVFSITMEDESYKLDISYGESTYLSGTASSIMEALATKAGLSMDEDAPTISVQVERSFSSETVKELLSSLCLEVGYTYMVRNGVVYLKALDNHTSSATCTDAHMSSFTLNRGARQYKDIVVSYEQYETSSIMVYNDITGQDATHECNISIPSHGTYPSESEAGYTGGGTKVEANDSVNGRTIVAILSDPTVNMVSSSTSVTASITREGGTDLFVKVSNPTSLLQTVTKLQATASCRVKVSDAKEKSFSTSEATMPYETEATWLHTRDTVKNYVSLLKNHFSYSNYTYTFESDEDYAMGQVVTISDDAISGTEQTVWVYGKETKDIGATGSKGQRYTYTAHSVSAYSTVTTYSDTYRATSGGRQGLQGKDGATVEIEYSLGTSLTEHPTTGWGTSQPTPTSSLPYVWRRERKVTED